MRRSRSWRSALYDLATTGQLFSPAYDHLYRLEAAGYPTLGYHADWAAEDPRYLLQNLGLALFGTPAVLPAALPDTLGLHAVAGLHAIRRRRAACSTRRARWPSRATPA